jgi:glycosyltransferase involved in cell wall biosynthesis
VSSPPLVSVVVPAYNVEAYIADTLESVRTQRWPNLQVIVVDDGSTDATAEAIRPFLEDTRFHYIHQPNAGVAAAQNTGIRAATGKFVALLGGDDLWLPEKIDRQVRIAVERPEAGLVFTNAVLFDDDGDVREYYPACYRYPEADLLEQLLVENPLCAGTVMIRTELLRKHGAFDQRLPVAEDYELWIRLAMAGVKVTGTMEILHRQRLRHDSLTGTRSALMHREMLSIYGKCLQLLPEPEPRRVLRRSIRATKSRLMVLLAREQLDAGHPRRAACGFVAAWLPKTSRRWLLGAALSCLVLGKWSKPEGRQLAGWVD